MQKNADGSVTVWFGPEAPAGQEAASAWAQALVRQDLAVRWDRVREMTAQDMGG